MNDQIILIFIDRSLKNLEKRESQGGVMGGRWVIIMMVENNRELREVPQPASAEYLSTLREAETNSRYIGIIIIRCNHPLH